MLKTRPFLKLWLALLVVIVAAEPIAEHFQLNSLKGWIIVFLLTVGGPVTAFWLSMSVILVAIKASDRVGFKLFGQPWRSFWNSVGATILYILDLFGRDSSPAKGDDGLRSYEQATRRAVLSAKIDYKQQNWDRK